MAGIKFFQVYFDCQQHVSMLSDQQAGQLFKSLFEFAVSGKIPEFSDGMVKMAFSFMTAQIERDIIRYEEKCERNRKNARKRWENNADECDRIQTDTTLCQKCQEKEEEKEKEKEEEEEKEKEENNMSDKSDRTPPKPKKHKFGEYGHVRLTDKEYQRLCEDYGTETADLYITKVDEYLQMTGKKSYKDYNLTIRKWLDRDNIRKRSGEENESFYRNNPENAPF